MEWEKQYFACHRYLKVKAHLYCLICLDTGRCRRANLCVKRQAKMLEAHVHHHFAHYTDGCFERIIQGLVAWHALGLIEGQQPVEDSIKHKRSAYLIAECNDEFKAAFKRTLYAQRKAKPH